MTFGEYVEKVQAFLAQHPSIKDHLVIYSEDDEGNGYGEVFYGPTIGVYDKEDFSFEVGDIPEDWQTLAVCIN